MGLDLRMRRGNHRGLRLSLRASAVLGLDDEMRWVCHEGGGGGVVQAEGDDDGVLAGIAVDGDKNRIGMG